MTTPAIRRRLFLASAAAAGLLAATGGAASGARRGGTLRLGLSGAVPADLPMGGDPGLFARILRAATHETLTEIAADGRLLGDVASDWVASRSGTVWTLTLRTGARFHDGRDVTAADIAASLAPHRADGLLRDVDRIDAIGTDRIRLTLAAPGDPDLPFRLSDPVLAIHAADDPTMGSGLYRLSGFDPGHRARLVRVATHRKDGQAGWFDAVDLISVPTGDARHAALVTGRVDAVDTLPPRAAASLAGNRAIAVTARQGNAHLRLDPPASMGPVAAAAFRRALGGTLDRAALVAGPLQGHGLVAADGSAGPIDPAWDPTRRVAILTPDAARAHLCGVGLSGSCLPLTLACDTLLPVAGAVTGAAAAIGLTLSPRIGPADFDAARLSVVEGRLLGPWSALAGCAGDGALVPAFVPHLAAYATTLGHPPLTGALYPLDDLRMVERWWFA